MTYNTHNAKRRLLQLPVVALRIREASSGKAEVNLMEVVRGVDYVKFQRVLATQASREASSSPALTKNELRPPTARDYQANGAPQFDTGYCISDSYSN